jgi:riboflavin synthase
MFTGLVEDVGVIAALRTRGNYRILSIRSRIAGENLQIGESVCGSGACLTVVGIDREKFDVEVSQETLARTTLGHWSVGHSLNLERALRADSRLGGHFVSGHVDDTGTVRSVRPVGESLVLSVSHDRQFDPLVVDKGSIAIDGVSLTVNRAEPGSFEVNLIPHTARNTTLRNLTAGGVVNLEFDLIGKYLAKMGAIHGRSTLTLEKLRESGW